MDVLVAGAGPVGLFAAHALAKKEVSVGIVDTGIWPCSHSYALALHPGTVDLLCKAGLAHDIVRRGYAVKRITFHDNARQRGSISLDEARPLVVLPQSALEAGLEAALNQEGVQVKWRHKVANVEPSGEVVRVTLNRYEKESRGYVVARTEWAITKTWTVEVPYVLGTDGYDSVVRRSLRISFPEVAPSSYYAVFEFQAETLAQNEVRIILGRDTTDVLWPLGGGWFRWSFEIPDYVDSEAERLAAQRARYGDPSDRFKDRTEHSSGDVHLLRDEHLSRLITSRAEWFHAGVGDIGWRTIVRFERRLATAFGCGHCWLAGDAAHLGAPVGVQSLNVGLAEAWDLTESLTAVHPNNGRMHEFEDYNRRYLREWKHLQGIERTVEALPDVDPWIWENRDRIIPCLPGHGRNLRALAAEIGLRVQSPA